MTRRRFSETAYERRLDEFNRCCALCGIKTGGAAGLEWDHVLPLKMGGDDELANLQPLCRGCHKTKTKRDQGHIAKAKRMQRRSAGIKRTAKRLIPGSKGSGLRKRMNGETIRVEE